MQLPVMMAGGQDDEMAGSVNKVILIGNVGADPEIRRTQDGRPIANLRIATSESWRDRNSGERKEKTEWHTVVVFNEGLCKVVEQYVKKGAKLYIEGQLQTRKWQDQTGNDRYSTEIVLQGFNSTLTMLDGRGEGGGKDRCGHAGPGCSRHEVSSRLVLDGGGGTRAGAAPRRQGDTLPPPGSRATRGRVSFPLQLSGGGRATRVPSSRASNICTAIVVHRSTPMARLVHSLTAAWAVVGGPT